MVDKKTASPRGAVIPTVLTLVVSGSLAVALCLCLESEPEPPELTPIIYLVGVDASVDSGSSPYCDKTIECMVESVSNVSEGDVKWDDLTYTVLVNRTVVRNATVKHESDDEYVSHGDRIRVTCNAFGDRSIVELLIEHVPTESVAGSWVIACT